jgi:hypothetical protein
MLETTPTCTLKLASTVAVRNPVAVSGMPYALFVNGEYTHPLQPMADKIVGENVTTESVGEMASLRASTTSTLSKLEAGNPTAIPDLSKHASAHFADVPN